MKLQLALAVARAEVAKREGKSTKDDREPSPDLVMYRAKNGQYMTTKKENVPSGCLYWSMELFTLT